MKDASNSEKESWIHHPDEPPPSYYLKFVVIGVLLGFGIDWVTWKESLGGGWTCDVGTAKYDSFDAWGGSMEVQEDGGTCTTEWKCGIDFSFSKEDGSILMSRRCLTRKAAAKDDDLQWTSKIHHLHKATLDCFVRKDDASTLTCATTSRLPTERIRIPSWLVEGFRKTLCDSAVVVNKPWFFKLFPFRSSSDQSLSCPSSPLRQGPFLVSPGWDAWWPHFQREMENLKGFVAWGWGWRSRFASYKRFPNKKSDEEEETFCINANGTLLRLGLLPDQDVLHSDLPHGKGVRVRILGGRSRREWLFWRENAVFIVMNFLIVPPQDVQFETRDRELLVRYKDPRSK